MNDIERLKVSDFEYVSIEPVSPINMLPEDILFYIFSFLSPKDLTSCSSVDSLWNRITQHNVLWKPKIQQDVTDDFISLVRENVLTWKEVLLYARLSNFVARGMQKKYCNDNFIKRENPELNSLEYASIYMPRPFVKYGDYSFSISCTTDIKIHKKEETEPAILVGEKEKTLVCLVVEGNYLFALRKDGIIIQWDYKKKEKINTIETACVKGHKSLDELKRSTHFYTSDSFYVKNGILVLKYGMGLKVLEIIPYSDPEKVQLIEDPSLVFSSRIVIEKDKIFILARNDIWIWNLLTNKREFLIKLNMDYHQFILDIALDKNILYAIDSIGELHVINLKTGKENKFSLLSEYLGISKIEVIGNLLFGFLGEDRIFVIDINSKELVKAIEFNFDFQSTETCVLNKLVEIAKANLQPLESKVSEQEDKDSFLLKQEDKEGSHWCIIS